MNKEIKKLWVDALLSDDYTQGTATLRGINPLGKEVHCCLGVLCDLALKHGSEKAKDSANHALIMRDPYLPKDVMKWAELTSTDPLVLYDKNMKCLSQINDKHVDFKTIASLIEERL